MYAYLVGSEKGIRSRRIFDYYKTHGFDTVVMSAGFRNSDQIRQLAGCDRLTISPSLMQELADSELPLAKTLDEKNTTSDDSKNRLDESGFRWGHNSDPMATEKLAEGIRLFAADQVKLEGILSSK